VNNGVNIIKKISEQKELYVTKNGNVNKRDFLMRTKRITRLILRHMDAIMKVLGAPFELLKINLLCEPMQLVDFKKGHRLF